MEEKMPVVEKEYSKGLLVGSIVLTIISIVTLLFTSFFFTMIMDGLRQGGLGMAFIAVIGFPIFFIGDGVTFVLSAIALGLSISNISKKANSKTITMLILSILVVVTTIVFLVLIFAH